MRPTSQQHHQYHIQPASDTDFLYQRQQLHRVTQLPVNKAKTEAKDLKVEPAARIKADYLAVSFQDALLQRLLHQNLQAIAAHVKLFLLPQARPSPSVH